MKRTVRTISCGTVPNQHCNASKWCTFKCALLENHLFHFFWEIRSKTELHCIFSVISSVLFLAEFKRRYSGTIASQCFTKNALESLTILAVHLKHCRKSIFTTLVEITPDKSYFPSAEPSI